MGIYTKREALPGFVSEGSPATVPFDWRADIDAAFAEARSSSLPVLLYFTAAPV
jgi:hypothetical protein